ncbi:unnamed protein product [Somion occarium]|uniref:F-box domain-containing protein n=1 Tax=Somion occarium TaxID=3059160 RepID=A0ABP1CU91_9APHY
MFPIGSRNRLLNSRFTLQVVFAVGMSASSTEGFISRPALSLPPVDVSPEILMALERRKLNASRPVAKLVPDVLTRIFNFFVAFKGFPWREQPPPFLLSSVCHYWRMVAISSPSIWSHVKVDRDGPDLEVVDLILARSSQLPLRVEVDETISTPLLIQGAGHILRTASNRIYKANFCLPSKGPHILDQDDIPPFPTLRSLFLIVVFADVSGDISFPVALEALEAPLQELHLIGVRPRLSSPFFSSHALRVLCIKILCPPWGDASVMHDILDMLRGLPTLQKLVLKNVLSGVVGPTLEDPELFPPGSLELLDLPNLGELVIEDGAVVTAIFLNFALLKPSVKLSFDARLFNQFLPRDDQLLELAEALTDHFTGGMVREPQLTSLVLRFILRSSSLLAYNVPLTMTRRLISTKEDPQLKLEPNFPTAWDYHFDECLRDLYSSLPLSNIRMVAIDDHAPFIDGAELLWASFFHMLPSLRVLRAGIWFLTHLPFLFKHGVGTTVSPTTTVEDQHIEDQDRAETALFTGLKTLVIDLQKPYDSFENDINELCEAFRARCHVDHCFNQLVLIKPSGSRLSSSDWALVDAAEAMCSKKGSLRTNPDNDASDAIGSAPPADENANVDQGVEDCGVETLSSVNDAVYTFRFVPFGRAT